MCGAAHVVTIVDVINVNRVCVAPAGRQRPANNKPIAVILKARMTRDNYRVANSEPVFPSKMRTEVVFRNASVMMAFMLFIADKTCVMFDGGHGAPSLHGGRCHALNRRLCPGRAFPAPWRSRQ